MNKIQNKKVDSGQARMTKEIKFNKGFLRFPSGSCRIGGGPPAGRTGRNDKQKHNILSFWLDQNQGPRTFRNKFYKP